MSIHTFATAPGAFDRLVIRNTTANPGRVTVHDAADVEDLGDPLQSFVLTAGARACVDVYPAHPFARGLTITADVDVEASASLTASVFA